MVNSAHKDWQAVFYGKTVKFKAVLLIFVLIFVGLIIASIDLYPSLSHMDIHVLSGPKSGQYYALGEKIAEDAKKRQGNLTNFSTTGVEDSLKLLRQGARAGKTRFAIVPDGLTYSKPDELELVARLPNSSVLLFLGREANHIHYISDLKDMRIGVGPHGSGSSLLARQLLDQKIYQDLNWR